MGKSADFVKQEPSLLFALDLKNFWRKKEKTREIKMSLATSVRTFGRPLITFRRQFSNTIVKVNICDIWELKFSYKMASKLILTLFFTLKHWRKMFICGLFKITHEMSENNIQIIFSSHCCKPYFFTRMSNKKPRDFFTSFEKKLRRPKNSHNYFFS